MFRSSTTNFLTENTKPADTRVRNDIISTFYQCDLGCKGYLDGEDLKVAVVALLGYKPSKVEIRRLLEDKNGLGLEAFVSLMLKRMDAKDEDEHIRSIFLAFDTQCRGFLTLDDLQKAVSVTAPHLPSHAIENAFRQIDRDADGRVSYRDFEYMMKYNTDLHI